MKIIDSHSHIFPNKIAEKATNSISDFYQIKMAALAGTTESLLAYGAEAGVEKYVVCSVATTAKQVRAINEYILGETLAHSEFLGLITLHPDLSEQELDFEFDFALKNGFRGIKLHSDFQKFALDDKKTFAIYERAQGVLPILVHAGDRRYSFSNPEKIARVANNFKNLQIVAAHFGGYSEWDKVFVLENCPNVYFDTSSSLEFLPAKTASSLILQMGVHRFLFGSDFPMWKHKKELENIMSLGLCERDLQAVLSKNAEAVWKI